MQHGINYTEYFQHSPRYYKNKLNKIKATDIIIKTTDIKVNFIKESTLNILIDLLDINLSFKMIAEKHQLTKQRVQQIYAKAKKAEYPGLPIRIKGRPRKH